GQTADVFGESLLDHLGQGIPDAHGVHVHELVSHELVQGAVVECARTKVDRATRVPDGRGNAVDLFGEDVNLIVTVQASAQELDDLWFEPRDGVPHLFHSLRIVDHLRPSTSGRAEGDQERGDGQEGVTAREPPRYRMTIQCAGACPIHSGACSR